MAMDLNEEGARASVEGVGDARAFQVDVTDEASVRRAFEAIDQAWGPVEVLVHCAGVCVQKRLGDTSLAEWDKVWKSNVTGAFLCAREAWLRMRACGRGHIINIASQAAGWPGANEIAYGTAKTAQVKFTLHLGFEGQAENRVRAQAGAEPGAFYAHAICPGAIDTPMNQQLGRRLTPDNLLRAEEVARLVTVLLESPTSGWRELQRAEGGLHVGEVGLFADWPAVIRIWREGAKV